MNIQIGRKRTNVKQWREGTATLHYSNEEKMRQKYTGQLNEAHNYLNKTMIGKELMSKK